MSNLCLPMRFAALAILGFGLPVAWGFQAATPSPTPDPGWPRQYTNGTARLELYQPEIDSWANFSSLTARFAAELQETKHAKTIYGTVFIRVETRVNLESRTVWCANFRVTEVHYPSAKDDPQLKAWVALTTELLPQYPTTLALDRVLAYMDVQDVRPRHTAVSLDPPPILVARQPAVLVIIDGDPIKLAVEDTDLQRVVNTNWDLFFDRKGRRYYLRDDKTWLSAPELHGAWTPVNEMPKVFSRLPANEEFQEIKKTASFPQKPRFVKLVLVVYKPTELIVLDGEPSFEAIVGTRLMWVSNTESDVFFDAASEVFYFLTSGRWFRSRELRINGWTAATPSLPKDFLKMPPGHPRAHVLASVPGTRQADEAVLAASIPRSATIERNTIKAQVQYVGEPKFEPIASTGVFYAVNTPNDVLRAENAFYLCVDGVWFVGASPQGPWEAADKIPEEIYGIPPDSPKYDVTYVTVHESTPSTVTYEYTSGYEGVYVGFGVAMWGTGYYYPPYSAQAYYPYPIYWPQAYYTYGASVWYNPATGAYVRGSSVYGPYGGYARGAAYSPSAGTYAWGQKAWGPYGAAASGGFYNPVRGTWAGGYRASNGYQSWGQSVVARGDQWARTATYSDSRSSVGAIRTSGGGKAIAVRGGQGPGFAGRSAAGDFYAGRDGNVYKRDQSGNWYRNNGGSWDPVSRPTSNQPDIARSGAQGNRETIQSLNRDAAARSRGNLVTQRAESARKSSGWTSGGWVGHRSSGFAIRSPGFGRR